LIERAGVSADKLEEKVRNNRPEPPAYSGKKVKDTVVPPSKDKPQAPVQQAEKEDEEEFKPKTDAERELLKALESVR
jgi:hypothetical protein